MAKLNPHGKHVRGLTKIGIKRYELDNMGFFSSNEEGDERQNTKMAESARGLKAPPLNKTRDWKPPPRFKHVLTLLRSSAEAGVMTKATPKCNALQNGALSVRNVRVATVQALTVTNNLQSTSYSA